MLPKKGHDCCVGKQGEMVGKFSSLLKMWFYQLRILIKKKAYIHEIDAKNFLGVFKIRNVKKI